MDSESSLKSSGPPLCANGCGFFGRPETQNMCCKCYRELDLNNNVRGTVDAELSPSVDAQKMRRADVLAPPIPDGTKKMRMGSVQDGAAKSGRCGHCNKMVGLARWFSCRCGGTYCPSHRYPEEQDCGFDYKEAGRMFIATANPVIKADKLERI